MIASWNANAFVLTDVPVVFPNRSQVRLDEKLFNIVVISTASYDEPIAEIMEAVSRLPDIGVNITGNYRDRQEIVKSAPGNIRFTGYVPDAEFYGLIEAAQVVMCLTTEDHTIQSGASEALWLGKPIITSDWPLLQAYFSKGTIHVDNTADSVFEAIVAMRESLQDYQAEIRLLQKERRRDWLENVEMLTSLVQQAVS
jgi:glycosyltransferase involved in cell wall biosynthesis